MFNSVFWYGVPLNWTMIQQLFLINDSYWNINTESQSVLGSILLYAITSLLHYQFSYICGYFVFLGILRLVACISLRSCFMCNKIGSASVKTSKFETESTKIFAHFIIKKVEPPVMILCFFHKKLSKWRNKECNNLLSDILNWENKAWFW